MIKGKIYYNNKNIKYKVVMKHDCFNDDIYIIVKTRFGKLSLFNDELTLDEFKCDIRGHKKYTDGIKCEIDKNEFLNKWNSYSCKEIKDIAEEFIRKEMDEDKIERDKKWKVSKLVCDFNYKGNYYEGLPKVKECINTVSTIEYLSLDGTLYEKNIEWKVSKKEGEN